MSKPNTHPVPPVPEPVLEPLLFTGSSGSPPIGEPEPGTAPRNRCPGCSARVITYDHDYHLDCYLGPTRLDPTPLTLNLAIACRLTGRPIYHHTRDRAGNRRLSRIWTRHHLPATGHILPAHHCGATTPTHLPPIDRNTTPEHAPF